MKRIKETWEKLDLNPTCDDCGKKAIWSYRKEIFKIFSIEECITRYLCQNCLWKTRMTEVINKKFNNN